MSGSTASLAKHLERDVAPQPEILGAVDVTHAARAESFEDAIVRQRLADHRSIITQSETSTDG